MSTINKPCPFCRSIEHTIVERDATFALRCLNCEALGPSDATSDGAITAWINTRPCHRSWPEDDESVGGVILAAQISLDHFAAGLAKALIISCTYEAPELPGGLAINQLTWGDPAHVEEMIEALFDADHIDAPTGTYPVARIGDGLIPTRPGFYWAKWQKADQGTREGEELTPSNKWEPVELNENCLDPNNTEYLKVSVHGVEKTQSPENFLWGPKVESPERSMRGGPVQIPAKSSPAHIDLRKLVDLVASWSYEQPTYLDTVTTNKLIEQARNGVTVEAMLAATKGGKS